MNWKVLLGGLLVVGALVAVLASGIGTDPRGESNALEGKPAATFTLESLAGESVSLAELRGKPVVINFWATWCQACKQEEAHLQQAAQVYGARGVTFLGVLYNDEASKARPYAKRHMSAFPHLMDPGGRVAIDYGVAGVPETFVVTPQGTIARKYSGPVSYQALAEVLEPLL